jgi:hypothetical protein
MKPKVSRAVEYSKGTDLKFRKKLETFLKQFQKQLINEFILSMADEQTIPETTTMAKDESLTFRPKNPFDEANLKRIKGKINKEILRDPEGFRLRLDDFIAKNMVRWVGVGNTHGRKIADWYVRNLAKDLSLAQKRGFLAAGIRPDVFKKFWSQDKNIGNFYVSPKVSQNFQNMVNETTGLITNMATNELAQVRAAFMDVFSGGGTLSNVTDVLNKMENVSKARAKRITLDQTLKLSNQIKTENCESLGITEGIWIHVPGQYTSRKTHIEMNGKRFKLSEGLYDPAVGRKVKCGELYYCRCVFRSVIPEEFM